MNALLLSAGLGTRFKPITDRIAKPAIPFLNIPLMGYMLYHLENSNLKNLVLNTHHLPRTVQLATECLTHGHDYSIQFSHEPVILGSGGGIRQAEKFLLGEYFVVANADEVLLFNHLNGLQPLIEFHKKNNALATLLTTEHPEAGKSMGGVWAHPNGEIYRLGGSHTEMGAKHFTGVFVFSSRIFAFMPKTKGEFHIFKDCLHQAMAANESVLAFHDPLLTWFDMSSERDYLLSTARALKKFDSSEQSLRPIFNRYGFNPEKVGSKKWIVSNAKFHGHLSPNSYLLMGGHSTIGRDVEVKGFAVIGPRAKFAKGVLENSIIASDIERVEPTSLHNQILI